MKKFATCWLLGSLVALAALVAPSSEGGSVLSVKEDNGLAGAAIPAKFAPGTKVRAGDPNRRGLPNSWIAIGMLPWAGLWADGYAGTTENKHTLASLEPQVVKGSRTIKISCDCTGPYPGHYIVSHCTIRFLGDYEVRNGGNRGTCGDPIAVTALHLKNTMTAWDQRGNAHKMTFNIEHQEVATTTTTFRINRTTGDRVEVSPANLVNFGFESSVSDSAEWTWQRVVAGVTSDDFDAYANVWYAAVVPCDGTYVFDKNQSQNSPRIALQGYIPDEGEGFVRAKFTTVTQNDLMIDRFENISGEEPGAPESDVPLTGSEDFIPDNVRDDEGEVRQAHGLDETAMALDSKKTKHACLSLPEKAYMGSVETGLVVAAIRPASPQTVYLASSNGRLSVPSSVVLAAGESMIDFGMTPLATGSDTITATFSDGSTSVSDIEVVAMPSSPELVLDQPDVVLIAGETFDLFTVRRTMFDDWLTSGTVVGISADDPSGVLGSLPSSVTIPAGENHVTVALTSTGVIGSAEIEFSSGGTLVEADVAAISGASVAVDVPDQIVQLGETITVYVSLSGAMSWNARPYDLEVTVGGLIALTPEFGDTRAGSDVLEFEVKGLAEGVETVDVDIDGLPLKSFTVTVVDE